MAVLWNGAFYSAQGSVYLTDTCTNNRPVKYRACEVRTLYQY